MDEWLVILLLSVKLIVFFDNGKIIVGVMYEKVVGFDMKLIVEGKVEILIEVS